MWGVGETPFTKSTILLNYLGGESAKRRVIYSCVSCHELLLTLNSSNIILIDYANLFSL